MRFETRTQDVLCARQGWGEGAAYRWTGGLVGWSGPGRVVWAGFVHYLPVRSVEGGLEWYLACLCFFLSTAAKCMDLLFFVTGSVRHLLVVSRPMGTLFRLASGGLLPIHGPYIDDEETVKQSCASVT